MAVHIWERLSILSQLWIVSHALKACSEVNFALVHFPISCLLLWVEDLHLMPIESESAIPVTVIIMAVS